MRLALPTFDSGLPIFDTPPSIMIICVSLLQYQKDLQPMQIGRRWIPELLEEDYSGNPLSELD